MESFLWVLCYTGCSKKEKGLMFLLQNLVAQDYTLKKTSILQQAHIFWQEYALVQQWLTCHLLSRNMLRYSSVHNHALSTADLILVNIFYLTRALYRATATPSRWKTWDQAHLHMSSFNPKDTSWLTSKIMPFEIAHLPVGHGWINSMKADFM